MIVEWSISMPSNFHAKVDGEIELDDDLTDEEIEEAIRDEVFQHIEWGWSKKESSDELDDNPF